MAISGVGATPEPNEQNPNKPQTTSNEVEDKKYSIFDKNQDGTVSSAEQIAAFYEELRNDSAIQEAFENGFDIRNYIDIFIKECKDVKTNISKGIDAIDVDIKVGSFIDNVINSLKEMADKYLKQNKTAPTNIGDGGEDNKMEYEKALLEYINEKVNDSN